MNYLDFLASKRVRPHASGFEPPARLNGWLLGFQEAIVRWGLRLGRAAFFADCGLGKTLMQLVWSEEVCRHTGGDALILCPLSVAAQTHREGQKFGIETTVCRSQVDVRPGVNITNYEMLRHFDTEHFVAVAADESSILKSFMGKTKRAIISSFADTPFRLACTATPAPNDWLELGNHAEFLGIMPSDEMIMRWFAPDSMHAGEYRLKGHAERDFWRWVATWAVSLSKPSDLGFSDEGFELPPLNFLPRVVEVDLTRDAQGLLFRMPELNATNLHREMRLTAEDRAGEVASLVAQGDGPWVLWCNTDYEADAIRAVVSDAVEIRGPESVTAKERKLLDFAEGRIGTLLTKPSICAYGLNWQHVHNMAFVGLSYSFEDLYQAIRRSWRFGQKREVNAYVVLAETEGPVLEAIMRKQDDHERMKRSMVEAMAETGLAATGSGRELSEVVQDRATGESWTLHLGDSCQTIRQLEDASVHLTVTSPPFEDLYIYSDSIADMGNSAGSEEFFTHFKFLIPELLRVTVPGRLCLVHCKHLPLYRGRDGEIGLRDFPGEIIRAFEACGWTFHSHVTIWKCPVTERERTNNNGLLHKTLCRDSSQVRQGMADFMLAFRKPPAGDSNLSAAPIVRPDGLAGFVGLPEFDPRATESHLSPYARKTHAAKESIDIWRRYAEPVWWDIDQTNVLQGFRKASDPEDDKHICPLQLDVIARCVELWSAPGDVVFDPFNGIGSTGYEAIRRGRRYVGIELKPSYFRQAIKHLGRAETEWANRGTLFDGESEEHSDEDGA